MSFFEKVLNIKLLIDAKHNNDNGGHTVPELYTGRKFAANVNNASSKFATDVNFAGGQQWQRLSLNI